MSRFFDTGVDMTVSCNNTCRDSGIADLDRGKHYVRTGRKAGLSYRVRREIERVEQDMAEFEQKRLKSLFRW